VEVRELPGRSDDIQGTPSHADGGPPAWAAAALNRFRTATTTVSHFNRDYLGGWQEDIDSDEFGRYLSSSFVCPAGKERQQVASAVKALKGRALETEVVPY